MSEEIKSDTVPPRSGGNPSEDEYHYTHAGIRERDGRIPFWLILVVLSLLGWSLYYLVRYWAPG
jgi:hypothetical protein